MRRLDSSKTARSALYDFVFHASWRAGVALLFFVVVVLGVRQTIRASVIDTGATGIEFVETTAPATSAAGRLRLYADATTHELHVSANGGGYTPLTGADPVPIFDFSPTNGSGIVNMTAWSGATTVIDCDARTDSGTTWVCGTGGTFTETGANVTSGAAAPFTERTARTSVYAGGAAHIGPDTTTGDITTENFSLLNIARVVGRSATAQIAGKLTGSTGYNIGLNSSSQYVATVNGTTITSAVTVDTSGQYDILELMCDRAAGAGSMRLYQNGYVIASGVCPAATATNAVAFKIMADDAGTGYVSGNVANVLLRKGMTMASTAAMDAQAQQNAQRIEGVWPATAVTAAPLSTDLRETVATIDIDRDQDGTIRLFRLGQKWLRVGKRKDLTQGNINYGGAYATGYLSENGAANKVLYSNNFGDASWVQLNGDNIQTDRYTAPDGTITGDRFRGAADAVGLEHGIRFTSTTLQAAVYAWSVFAFNDTSKAARKQFVWLRDKTIGDAASAWFDTYSCTVAAVGTGVHAYADPPMMGITSKGRAARGEYWGSFDASVGVCRFTIIIDGTVATHQLDIGVSDAASVFTSLVTTTNDNLMAFWGAQLEKIQDTGRGASTPIYSLGTEADRNIDGLQFNINNVPREHMMVWGVFATNSNLSMREQSSYTCTPYKDANNYVLFKPTQSFGNGQRGVSLTVGAGQGIYADVITAGVSQLNCCGNAAGFGQYYTPGSYHANDGKEHHARAIFFDNDARAYMDGDSESGITDTTVTMPDLTGGHLDIGYESAGLQNHTYGLITFCQYYDQEFIPTYP